MCKLALGAEIRLADNFGWAPHAATAFSGAHGRLILTGSPLLKGQLSAPPNTSCYKALFILQGNCVVNMTSVLR